MRKSIFKNQRGFSLIELMVVVAIIGLLAAVAIPNYQQFQRKAIQTEARTKLGAVYTSQMTFINEWGYGTTSLELLGYDQKGSNSYYVVGWHADDDEELVNKINVLTGATSRYRGPAPSSTANINSYTYKSHSMAYDVPAAGGATGLISKLEKQGTCMTNAQITDGCSCSKSYSAATGNQCATGTASGCRTSSNNTTACATERAGAVINASLRNVSFQVGATGVIDGSTNTDNLDQWTINQDKTLENTNSGL